MVEVDEQRYGFFKDEPQGADVFRDELGEEAEGIGLTKEELLAARESYLRQWPQDGLEKR